MKKLILAIAIVLVTAFIYDEVPCEINPMSCIISKYMENNKVADLFIEDACNDFSSNADMTLDKLRRNGV